MNVIKEEIANLLSNIKHFLDIITHTYDGDLGVPSYLDKLADVFASKVESAAMKRRAEFERPITLQTVLSKYPREGALLRKKVEPAKSSLVNGKATRKVYPVMPDQVDDEDQVLQPPVPNASTNTEVKSESARSFVVVSEASPDLLPILAAFNEEMGLHYGEMEAITSKEGASEILPVMQALADFARLSVQFVDNLVRNLSNDSLKAELIRLSENIKALLKGENSEFLKMAVEFHRIRNATMTVFSQIEVVSSVAENSPVHELASDAQRTLDLSNEGVAEFNDPNEMAIFNILKDEASFGDKDLAVFQQMASPCDDLALCDSLESGEPTTQPPLVTSQDTLDRDVDEWFEAAFNLPLGHDKDKKPDDTGARFAA